MSVLCADTLEFLALSIPAVHAFQQTFNNPQTFQTSRAPKTLLVKFDSIWKMSELQWKAGTLWSKLVVALAAVALAAVALAAVSQAAVSLAAVALAL